MEKEDFYQLLGVAKDASNDELKKSYRKLAMKYHPDRNPNDEAAAAQFRSISEAYEVLSDPQKRAAYDQFGHAAFEQGGGRQGRGGAGGFHDIGDIFEEFFGGGGMGGARGRAQQNRGSDQRYDLNITLEEAFRGKSVEIRVPSVVACDDCDGSGAQEGSKKTTCKTCNGHGKVRASQGFFTIERPCHACQGQGQVIEKPCKSCHGQGRVRKNRNLAVDIPAGVDDGSKIRLSGEGEAGFQGGNAGDLYIFLSVLPHKFFERRDRDIFCKIPVSMIDAALGGELDVPILDGTKARIKIPSGTQTGKRFRLRGKGMSILRSQNRGDMFVEVEVEVPVNLTQAQKECLEQFKEAGGSDDKHSPLREKFVNKVKEFWSDLTD
ncbi:MAG: molecular chaperone DnaJ [Alphaproteobacteria bacterium]